MYLIAGLGNPGEQYEKTPHNSGFLFLDKLRLSLKENTDLNVGEWAESRLFQSQFCKVEKDSELVLVLQKPQTFMNRSGYAVKGAIRRFRLTDFPSELIVVHDDLDMKLGTFKIQKEKSPKGHNGVIDIENSLKSKDFLRVRIGVDGREGLDIPGEKYVLTSIKDDQYSSLEASILSAVKQLREVIRV
jgi:PTH1 family peptidyl-tRNA hydrolase